MRPDWKKKALTKRKQSIECIQKREAHFEVIINTEAGATNMELLQRKQTDNLADMDHINVSGHGMQGLKTIIIVKRGLWHSRTWYGRKEFEMCTKGRWRRGKHRVRKKKSKNVPDSGE